jgi:uncharacterized protein
MNESLDQAPSKAPLIKPGWLRVLLFCILYFTLVLAIVFGVALVILWLKGNPGGTPQPLGLGEPGQEKFLWLTVVGNLVISLLLVLVFRKGMDRKSFFSLGFSAKGYGSDALSGLFLAIALIGTGTLFLHTTSHLKWTDINFSGSDLFIDLGLLVMIAFTEELVFRGYILNNLMDSFNKWIALGLSALLFTLFHLDNPGISTLPAVNIFLAGILLGLNYIYTRNLWFAILFHLGWNFFQGPVLGFGVSGLNLSSLLQPELKGDLSITGGDFGFEGSVLDAALTVLAIVSLFLVYEGKHKSIPAKPGPEYRNH